ncbi:MAG: hypothetical protein HYW91_02895 [Candidatus Sungbacteria bacterium]|nr:hypothetical protein [Candidatus Sungbacteria bacterium]
MSVGRKILPAFLAILLLFFSWAAFQYRETRTRMEEELATGSYPAALNSATALRRTVFLFPLWWGTPFFMSNIAGEIAFIEGEAWYSLGEKTKARESYARAAGLFSRSRRLDRAKANYNNAVVALEMDKYLEARDLLHRTLDPSGGDPHHAGAKANLERLEQLAAANPSLSADKGASSGFMERDPLSPWSKDKKSENKPDEKRR